MRRLVTVLEDSVRFRDGKKWKQRYCMLNKPDSKTGKIVMYITKQFGPNVLPQVIDEKLSRQYLIDEITGFEYGRHVDKEGSVMALIGRNVVYCIAFSQNETMFRWAETLNKYLKCAHFHATLKKLSETSGLFNKITSGVQGNLHVQSMRLCLIGEPADGNKFICEWPISQIISIDFFNTGRDKVKEMVIKCNGKVQKMKGSYELEISFTQNSFTESFEPFLRSCQVGNEDFKTNFKWKKDSFDGGQDNTSFSYSILSKDFHCSNSDNSSSLEKRSSEIPIPRSREHSGPDQRPIDNVQIKIRKSKNFKKVLNENKKHFSLIETSGTFDHNDVCLFDDDEEIADQVDNKNRNVLYEGLSQESSGVCVNGASSSARDLTLSAGILTKDDSGCGNLSSTSSTTQNEGINLPNVLPPSQKRCNHKDNVFLMFYRNIIRNPLLLVNYKKYYQLLRAVSDNHCQMMKRSSSFNCVHLSEKIQIGYCRKYSQSNFPLNLNYQMSDNHFNHWRDRIGEKITQNNLINTNKTETDSSENLKCSSRLLSNRLPFRSVKEFHNSVIKSSQNGTVCLNLFCYHHFLMLLNDLKTVIKNLESKQKSFETSSIHKYKLANIDNEKFSIYNRWLEKIQMEYCKSFDVDNRSKRASILDINLILIYEIASSIFNCRKCYALVNGSCDSIPRHQSYYVPAQPTIELNSDKGLLKRVDETNLKHAYKPNSMYLISSSVMCNSSSTPDFRYYNQTNHTPKQNDVKDKEVKYQNLSPIDTFDTMNHTFPKQNMSLNKAESSQNKGGSFKKFRRKYSPGFLMPFFHFGSAKFSNTMFTRRKTPSTHSTLSEPICHSDNKDNNTYYNILSQPQTFTKRSLSVVLDSSYPYEDAKECHNYINVPNAKTRGELMYKPEVDVNNYICSGPSSVYEDISSYPEEILDPRLNYGNLRFIKSNCSKMKFLRHDNTSESSNLLNFRRSSLSILSNKSLQNYSSSRPTSFRKHGYSNISQSDVSSGAGNIADFGVGGCLVSSSSPQSTQSCSFSSGVSSSFQRAPIATVAPVPPPQKSLNYITVMENNYPQKQNSFSRPLSIYPPGPDSEPEPASPSSLGNNKWSKMTIGGPVGAGGAGGSHGAAATASFKRGLVSGGAGLGALSGSGLSPQTSPVVDYCQIDLTGTYALREVDLIHFAKLHCSRDAVPTLPGNGGPLKELGVCGAGSTSPLHETADSASTLDHYSLLLSGTHGNGLPGLDNTSSNGSYSVSSGSSLTTASITVAKDTRKSSGSSNKKCLRRLFSRKPPSSSSASSSIAETAPVTVTVSATTMTTN